MNDTMTDERALAVVNRLLDSRFTVPEGREVLEYIAARLAQPAAAVPDMAAAYELLLSTTTPNTYGRQAIQLFRDTAYPEEAKAAEASRKTHCPYCYSRIGGPLICCDAGYLDKEKRDYLTEVQAAEARARLIAPAQEVKG